MKRVGFIVSSALAAVAVVALVLLLHGGHDAPRISGALQALDTWAAARAYPGRTIPALGHYQAFRAARAARPRSAAPMVPPWTPIGPHNIGGRTLALALDPDDRNRLYAGSAVGGLWVSESAGVGADAWDLVPTGYPVLAVSSIAIEPGDASVIYVGTGEVYAYQDSGGGISVRTTRGSYGIGILKSTDRGASWSPSLDWTRSQERGVWAVEIDPLDPDVVWAATTEGCYKSLDAGASWTRVHDVIMAMDLEIHPLDPDIVLLACGNLGSAGHGIYRTTDGGASWTHLTDGLPPSFGGKIWLDLVESAPQTIYASIGNGTAHGDGTWLCRSDDGGDHWQVVNTEDYATYQGWFAHLVLADPRNPERLVVGGVDLWTSDDGGATLTQRSYWWNWEFGRTPAGGPEGPEDYSHADHHFALRDPVDPERIFFANDGGVFRSTDGGMTFAGINGGYQTTQFYPGFSCAADDSAFAIGGMQDNATAIYDGSLEWIRVLGADGAWTAIDPTDHENLYGSVQFLGIYASTDAGESWAWTAPPWRPNTGFIAPFAISFDEPSILYAGSDLIYRTTSGGSDWIATNGGMALDGNPALSLAVARHDADVVYATTAPVYGAPGVFVTTNGGESWTDIGADLPDRYPMDVAIDPLDDARAYVAFSGFGSSHLFKTEDRGGTWSDLGAILPDVPTSAVVVDPLATDQLYVGNDLGVYLSLDGGASWAEFSEGLPDAVIVLDLTLSELNRTLRVATHGNGVFERRLVAPGTEVGGGAPVPEARVARLAQNRPNPFNPLTTIRYWIGAPEAVRIEVYDLSGRRVRTLVDEARAAGEHSVRFDASGLASGTYIYRLRAGEREIERRMLLLK